MQFDFYAGDVPLNGVKLVYFYLKRNIRRTDDVSIFCRLAFPAVLKDHVITVTTPPDLFTHTLPEDRYLESASFHEWCDLVGLEPDYVRKLVNHDIDTVMARICP